LAFTAAKSEPFSKARSEFLYLLHFELNSAVSAKNVDVLDPITPARSAASLLQKPPSNALNVEIVITAEEAAHFGLLADSALLIQQLGVRLDIIC
jgi:hypothetical protein